MRGWITNIKFKSDDASYDFKIIDSEGDDVLAGLGEGQANGTAFLPEPGSGKAVLKYVNGDYTLVIEGADAAATGKVTIDVKNQ